MSALAVVTRKRPGAAHAVLNAQEYMLLQSLRRAGFDIRHGLVDNGGKQWRHERVIVRGGRSWAYSIDR
jgi:hypothetical protein